MSDDLSLSFTMLRLDEKIPALLFLLREVIPDKQQTVVWPGRCCEEHVVGSIQLKERGFQTRWTLAPVAMSQDVAHQMLLASS